MISKKQYVEHLLSTPFNYTCTNLADHLDGVSHDVVNDFLRQEHLRPHQLWELVRGRIEDSPEAFLIADDSVQDKRYSRFIELVKWQYSGAEHQTVKGIGVVNLVHSNGQAGDFYPIDYRVYAPDIDHKSKNDHFREMFLHAVEHKALKARTILFDAWYASAENLKLIHRRHWTFFTTLKSNRLVSLSKEEGYIHLDEIDWTPERRDAGVIIKLKEVPFKVRLFKVVAAPAPAHPGDEGRLPRAELAAQADHIAGDQPLAEARAEPEGLFGRMAHEIQRAFVEDRHKCPCRRVEDPRRRLPPCEAEAGKQRGPSGWQAHYTPRVRGQQVKG